MQSPLGTAADQAGGRPGAPPAEDLGTEPTAQTHDEKRRACPQGHVGGHSAPQAFQAWTATEISVCRVLSAAAASVRGDPRPHGKRKSQTAPDAGESARRDGGPGPAHAGRTTWGSQGRLGLWLTQPHGGLCSGSSKTHADGPRRAPRAPCEDNAGGFCCFQRATAAFSEHSNERQRHRPVWEEGKWKQGHHR